MAHHLAPLLLTQLKIQYVDKTIGRNQLFYVWLATMAATVVMFSKQAFLWHKLPAVVLMGIAYLKCRLVFLYFMELSDAPFQWRLVFEAWLIGVSAMVLYFYYTARV